VPVIEDVSLAEIVNQFIERGWSALATVLYVILTVFVPVLVAVVGLVLVQRLVPPDLREEHNNVAGFIYAVLGVAYAVLLAFVVIAVWQDYKTAQTNVESEANELAGVYFLASRLPEPERTQVQDLARTYARVVVEEEWPMMEQGETSPRADSLVRQLRSKLLEFDPRTRGEQVLYERGLTQLHDALDARRSRLLEVREGIPNLLWVVLVVGGVITVSFTYLFGLKSNVAHGLMVGALTLVICGILFTIAEFNNPFSGPTEIRPEAFREVLRSFGGT
jgi:ABC-type multidrug transport system fused ATPase/permease subunit